MYPYLISVCIHAFLLCIVLLWPHPQPPKPADLPIEITMVALPMGDHGQMDRPTPKHAPSLRKSSIAQAPSPVMKRDVQPQVVTPKEKAPTKATTLDIDAALKSRFSDERDTDRAEQIAQAMEGSGAGGTEASGLTGDGQGMKGELAARGVSHRVFPAYPDWAKQHWLEGDVRLKIWVNAVGAVTRVEVVGLSGTSEFDSRAVEAMRQWRFAPLLDPNGPEQVGTITINYRLEKPS